MYSTTCCPAQRSCPRLLSLVWLLQLHKPLTHWAIMHFSMSIIVFAAIFVVFGNDISAETTPTETVIVELPESTNSIGMKFKLLPAGTFTMGEGANAHEVMLTKPFRMGIHEVTQAQYRQVMGGNPSKSNGANNPVELVSWDDAIEFCRRLSDLPAEKAVGQVYHLPTEAQWEYACRAGTTTKYSFGDDNSTLGNYAWARENSGEKTHPVSSKQPNPWGLYDMHGNVWEWCQDLHGDYPSGSVTDPTGARFGSSRVLRGGSWAYSAVHCRSANRGGLLTSNRSSSLGFRVCLSSPGK